MQGLSSNHIKIASHALKEASKRLLCLGQIAGHLDFHTRENRDSLAYHLGSDLNGGPAADIRPSVGGGMQRAGSLNYNQGRFTS